MCKRLLAAALSVLCTAAMTLSSPLAAAADSPAAVVASREEVVYANLGADGEVEEIYAVNVLDVATAGAVTEYGAYSEVRNLTDTNPLALQDGAVAFEAPAGLFYYQGNLTEQALPWRVRLEYRLDGAACAPKDTAGRSGRLEIALHTEQNGTADPVFFDNYMLQVTLTLDTGRCANIEAPGATLANAGKNKQITFTVMPGQSADLTVSADVRDFQMDGVSIAAVPFSMSVDLPDTSGMTGQMKTLADAIGQLYDGVGALRDSVADFSAGADSLQTGSASFQDGLTELSGQSSRLESASRSIQDALYEISAGLHGSGTDDLDMSALNQLPGVLMQFASGIRQAADGVTALQTNWNTAFSTLGSSIEAIPATQISEADLQDLYAAVGGASGTVNQLVAFYQSALTVRGTYTAMKDGLTQLSGSLTTLSQSLGQIADGLEETAKQLAFSMSGMDIADSLGQLSDGISSLIQGYNSFQDGLSQYLGGVDELAGSYGALHDGVAALTDGAAGLASGVDELYTGVDALHNETEDLPEQMDDAISTITDEYQPSDFTPVSFVSSENGPTDAVQFVMKTAAIVPPEPPPEPEPVREENFFTRLLALFQ